MTKLIRGAHVIDPSCAQDGCADILIQDGVVAKVGRNISADADSVLDGSGLVAAPGLVDMHVHLRDPGQTHKEDMHTAAAAALAGGVTTMLAMPNTSPVVDNPQIVQQILDKSKPLPVHILQAAAVSSGLGTQHPVEFAALVQAGAAAFSDDGKPVHTDLLEHALLQAAANGVPFLAHCEDAAIAGDGIINEGNMSRRLGVPGIPAAAEDVGTAREIDAAARLGVPVHICHVSTKGSVELVRKAKRAGVQVTAETAPHYFSLTEDVLQTRDANLRMNPPLRTQEDRQAVIQGLQDGTIDCIATDHAPHTAQEKADFRIAPNGVVGLETSLAAGITYLVNTGKLTLCALLAKLSTTPARILGCNAGTLQAGAAADIVLFDPLAAWTVQPQELHSKSKNTPYAGLQLQGQVRYTLFGGNVVYSSK